MVTGGWSTGYGHTSLPTSSALRKSSGRLSARRARAHEVSGSICRPPVQTLVCTDVWINSSSRVYHCSETRYLHNTGGELMREQDARQRGFRPAYGRPCRLDQPDTIRPLFRRPRPLRPLPPLRWRLRRRYKRERRYAWVNASSKIITAPSRYFGTTARSIHDRTGRGGARESSSRRQRCGAAGKPSPTSEATSAAALPAVEPSPAQTPEVQVWSTRPLASTTVRELDTTAQRSPGRRWASATLRREGFAQRRVGRAREPDVDSH